MATNKSQDDYHKQGMRIPRDLHARIHEAAAAAGRSYNSELIARLTGSFEAADTEELHKLYRDLEMEKLRKAAVSNELNGLRFLTLQLTSFIPPGFLDRRPDLAEAVANLKANEREMTLQALEQMIVGLLGVGPAVKGLVDKGALKVVKEEDIPAQDAEPKRRRLPSIAKPTKTLIETLENMPPDLVMELYERPAVREVMKLGAEYLQASDDGAPEPQDPQPTQPRPSKKKPRE